MFQSLIMAPCGRPSTIALRPCSSRAGGELRSPELSYLMMQETNALGPIYITVCVEGSQAEWVPPL
jgi:hypothetical protein